jgi:hypothetical protein
MMFTYRFHENLRELHVNDYDTFYWRFPGPSLNVGFKENCMKRLALDFVPVLTLPPDFLSYSISSFRIAVPFQYYLVGTRMIIV